MELYIKLSLKSLSISLRDNFRYISFDERVFILNLNLKNKNVYLMMHSKKN
jgi:hypothetical protein